MNKLTIAKRKAIVAALVEGNSIRATCRMTGAAKNTVVKLLCDLGWYCQLFHDRTMQNLPCKTIQVDETWSFCYAKAKNVPAEKMGVLGYGDVWTWVALDADTKLVPAWHVGARDAGHATVFISGLAARLSNRIQLTSDGHRPYLNAVDRTFGENIDYAMLVKLYGHPKQEGPSTRYSPGECIACEKQRVTGNPDPEKISTSFIERQNLTMRMSMRRFTRLTNAFSKKLENLERAVALHFTHYNFCRVHQTLGMTPAQATGVADKKWSIEDLLKIMDSN